MRRFLLLLVLIVPLGLSGCAVLDWFVGTEDPAPVVIVPDDPTTPDIDETVYSAAPPEKSPLDHLIGFAEGMGPAGGGAALVLGLLGENYRRKRKKKKNGAA